MAHARGQSYMWRTGSGMIMVSSMQIECLPTCKGNGAKYEKISVSGYLERKYKQMMETKPEANDSTVLEG